MRRGNITGPGLRRSNSRRSRIPAFSPTCRPFQFRFPEHDWNKESLSSNSFRAVGRRPDKFALSDPVEADAATCGLRAIGAVVVQIEQVEAGTARSISAKFKAAAGWRPRGLSAAFAALRAFPNMAVTGRQWRGQPIRRDVPTLLIQAGLLAPIVAARDEPLPESNLRQSRAS